MKSKTNLLSIDDGLSSSNWYSSAHAPLRTARRFVPL